MRADACSARARGGGLDSRQAVPMQIQQIQEPRVEFPNTPVNGNAFDLRQPFGARRAANAEG